MTDPALVLVGGRVLDPASGLDAVADVVILGNRIVEVGFEAGASYPDSERRDCAGLLVTPGLIDLHTHVFPGLGDFCVHPDRAGVEVGVPIVVDGGTSGVATFGLARRVIEGPDVRTRVLAWLDPCQLYLATKDFIAHKLRIADDLRNLDLASTARALDEHADVVVGLKVRATTTDDPGSSPFLEGAKSVAGERPIMIHLGSYPYTPSLSNLDAISALRAGDVVTHAFRGHSGFPVDGGIGVDPRFAAAIDRGVRLDLGHSGSDFRFDAARQLIALGYLPTTVSTDLNLFNDRRPVVSLPETMSKILALGVPLRDVVAMATSNAATSIHRSDELGSLAPGRTAEVSVLQIEAGPAELSDGFETVTADQRLTPVGCLRAGVWIDADPALHPAALAVAAA
jgi:dihydroorotase